MTAISLPIKYQFKTVSIEEMQSTYKYTEVLGYCQHCNNYGKNYSCPDFDFDVFELISRYKYITLIITQVEASPLTENWQEIKALNFRSRLSSVHANKGDNSDSELIKDISIFVFEQMKDYLSDTMLVIEQSMDDTLSSPPGSCTRCEECFKETGKPCLYPESLRYSLESLGYMVSDIYNEFFGLVLEWSHDKLPNNFYTCSGIFSNQFIDSKSLESYFEKRFVLIENK